MQAKAEYASKMSARSNNLLQCPRCDQGLQPSDECCPNCNYTEIENVDILDLSEQREYKQQRQFQRAAWIEFDKALHEKLEEFGESWPRLENWNDLWNHVESKAQAVGFDKTATSKRARVVSVLPKKETTISPSPNLEAVREWVAGLPDGEVNVISWLEFLRSLPQPGAEQFLEDFRDAEIRRQFAQFGTVHVDSDGNLKKGERKRTKRLVENLGDGCELVMVLIPAGRFQMGSDRYRWEQPIHAVDVPSFCLGQFAVTQAQWRAVASWPKVELDLKENISAFKGDNLPVDSVSWAEATEFCLRLQGQTGKPYRLPSEAEWEYACRAASQTEFAFGDNISPVVVNYDETYSNGPNGSARFHNGTVPVGSLGAANNFGLYDMHGNVCEWCADEWHDSYEGAPRNGEVWSVDNSAAQRVVRGGSWANTAEICRSSDRSRESLELNIRLHYMGFRVALSL